MAHAVDVAAYILECLGSVSTMKLQKLTFYSQAYYLVEHGTPLFPRKSLRHGQMGPWLQICSRGIKAIRSSRGFFGPLVGARSYRVRICGDRPCRWLPEELDGSQSQRIDS